MRLMDLSTGIADIIILGAYVLHVVGSPPFSWGGWVAGASSP